MDWRLQGKYIQCCQSFYSQIKGYNRWQKYTNRGLSPVIPSMICCGHLVERKYFMGIISWIVMGLVAGALAKWIMPGNDPGGLIVTILIGIAGAFVGGFIGTQVGLGSVTGFDLVSMALAIGGALVLLYGYRLLNK